jgi:hypothetical protein
MRPSAAFGREQQGNGQPGENAHRVRSRLESQPNLKIQAPAVFPRIRGYLHSPRKFVL